MCYGCSHQRKCPVQDDSQVQDCYHDCQDNDSRSCQEGYDNCQGCHHHNYYYGYDSEGYDDEDYDSKGCQVVQFEGIQQQW